jgi:hypothetical protein
MKALILTTLILNSLSAAVISRDHDSTWETSKTPLEVVEVFKNVEDACKYTSCALFYPNVARQVVVKTEQISITDMDTPEVLAETHLYYWISVDQMSSPRFFNKLVIKELAANHYTLESTYLEGDLADEFAEQNNLVNAPGRILDNYYRAEVKLNEAGTTVVTFTIGTKVRTPLGMGGRRVSSELRASARAYERNTTQN